MKRVTNPIKTTTTYWIKRTNKTKLTKAKRRKEIRLNMKNKKLVLIQLKYLRKVMSMFAEFVGAQRKRTK